MVQALRSKTPAKVRADVNGFAAKYVQLWKEWLAAGAEKRPELFGQILRKWQAVRPGAVRRLRSETPPGELSLNELMEEAEEPRRVLADLNIVTIRQRTPAQEEALDKLWRNFSRLRTNSPASCVGISKAILLLTDGRIGPAFDSRVRRNLGVTRPTSCAEWLEILDDVAEDIAAFERVHGPLKAVVPSGFAQLEYGRLHDMALGPRDSTSRQTDETTTA